MSIICLIFNPLYCKTFTTFDHIMVVHKRESIWCQICLQKKVRTQQNCVYKGEKIIIQEGVFRKLLLNGTVSNKITLLGSFSSFFIFSELWRPSIIWSLRIHKIGLSIIQLQGTEFIISHTFQCKYYFFCLSWKIWKSITRVILLDTVQNTCIALYQDQKIREVAPKSEAWYSTINQDVILAAILWLKKHKQLITEVQVQSTTIATTMFWFTKSGTTYMYMHQCPLNALTWAIFEYFSAVCSLTNFPSINSCIFHVKVYMHVKGREN